MNVGQLISNQQVLWLMESVTPGERILGLDCQGSMESPPPVGLQLTYCESAAKNHDRTASGGWWVGRPSLLVFSLLPSLRPLGSSLGSKKRILYTSLTASLLQRPKQQIPRYVLGLLIVFVILFSFKRNFYFDVLEYFCSLCCTAMHYPPGSHPSLHHSLRNTFIIQTWFSFMKGFEALMFKAWTRRWIMKGIVFHHSLAATIAETTWSENFLEFK